MKNIILSIILMIPVSISKGSILPIKIKNIHTVVEYKTPNNIHISDTQIFLYKIGIRESNNNYSAVNSYGYLGKYQFGMGTLESIGVEVTKQEFLNSPKLQEEAMVKLMKYNQKLLKGYINKYDNTYHNGIFITESGILSAAHLGGYRNVKRYFDIGYVFKDGYGTSIESYLIQFSGYNLEFV